MRKINNQNIGNKCIALSVEQKLTLILQNMKIMIRKGILILIILMNISLSYSQTQHTGWYYATEDIADNYPNHKQGNIYHDGELINIRGVNWWHINSDGCGGLGLSMVGIDELLETIKDGGFNTIRFAYTADMIRDYMDSCTTCTIECVEGSYPGNDAFFNDGYPYDYPKTRFEALEVIINKCKDEGLYVLLDHHGIEGHGIWYNPPSWTETDYVETLTEVADHFSGSGYEHIIGIDIYNEPYGAKWDGSGDEDDLRSFANYAGALIRDENPDWLIFVEGIQHHYISALNNYENSNFAYNPTNLNPCTTGSPCVWMNGQYGQAESIAAYNISPYMGCTTYAINADSIAYHKLVFSPHTYQFNRQYVDDHIADLESYLTPLNDFRWGNLSEDFAVIFGEFGAIYENCKPNSETWFKYFVNYMAELKLPGSFYWSINGNDTLEVCNGEGLALLEGDWETYKTDKLKDLKVLYGIVEDDITSAGGEIYSPRDGTTYTFDANDFTSTSTIKHKANNWSDLEGFPEYDNLHSILHEFYVTSTESLATNQEYEIQVTYTDNELGSVDESLLAFFHWNSSTSDWDYMDQTTVNTSTNTVTISTDLFGHFAVFGWNKQIVSLPQGWSLFSTYIDPIDANVATVLTPVVNNINVIKDETGNVYWPAFTYNQIGNFVIGEGYQASMSTGCTVDIIGRQVVPEDETIYLTSGWSIVGYLRDESGDIEAMLTDLNIADTSITEVLIIKDEIGNVYWPKFGTNQIGDLEPGEGYQISMENSASFIYPENTEGGGSKSEKTSRILEYKNYTQDLYVNTDNFMIVGIPVESWETVPEIGDEIAAYGENGQLVGKSIFKDGFTAITIYGDDQYTPNVVENLAVGESFTVEIWNSSKNENKEYKFKNWMQGDGYFSNKKISVVGIEENRNTNFEKNLKIEVYPNPSNGQFYLTFDTDEEISANLYVYNQLGELQYSTTVNKVFGKVVHKLDLTKLATGKYTLQVELGEFTKSLNIVIGE